MPMLFLLVAVLLCNLGDRSIDLNKQLPPDLQAMDFVISIEPFYARLYIYEPDAPKHFQQCCSNKATSVIHVPTGNGHFA
jgi:hypothetical protein